MHPRNPYSLPPDFMLLAQAYPLLKPHLLTLPDGKATIDFKNEASQRRLTEALLHRDFGIALELPESRLCPPIPNRLNYILWLQDILRATSDDHGQPVRGLDIGTGASAVYPLLACKLEPHWLFTATEVDELSLEFASSNVERNGLSKRVELVQTTPDGPILLPFSLHPHLLFDFTMCNPPFYNSREDVETSAVGKVLEPNSVCTGAEVEMITPGGECNFVCRMISESLGYRNRCRWYTSMLGKLSSVSEVVTSLRQQNISNYGITEFIQGQTRRWAVAWSFSDVHLPDSVARISNPSIQHVMPPRNTLRQPFPQATNQQQLVCALKTVLGTIGDISFSTMSQTFEDVTHTVADVVAIATRDTWSRAARRRNKVLDADPIPASTDHPVISLKCRFHTMTIFDSAADGEASSVKGTPVLETSWMEGRDRALFESFCSHVNRKLAVLLTSETSR